MAKNFKNRMVTWKLVLLSPAIKVFFWCVAAIRFLEWVFGKLPSRWQEKWGSFMIPHLSWQTWIIIFLVGLVILILESAYRLISQKEEESKTKENELKKQLGKCQTELEQLLTQHKYDNFIPLSEVVKKLSEEGLKQTQDGSSLDYDFKMQNPDGEYDRLTRLIAKYIDIYGKQPSSSSEDWVKINEHINNGFFKKLASEFYIKRYVMLGPDFIDLAIKKDNYEKAINDIMLYENPLYQG